MDVRFYPTAGGNSIPGDPQNLDFAHCLGYYNFNKVRHVSVCIKILYLCVTKRNVAYFLCCLDFFVPK